MSSLEILKKCAVQIGYRYTLGKYTKTIMAGTGFIVQRSVHETRDSYPVYIVTAKHLIKNIQEAGYEIIYQLNRNSGQVYWGALSNVEWIFHSDDSVGIAIFSSALWVKADDHFAYALDTHIAESQDQEHGIKVGDPVFLAGILHLHHWRTTGLPIVRSGNIMATPDDVNTSMQLADVHEKYDPELTEHLRPFHAIKARDKYLIECRSVSGMTGAPVFMRQTSIEGVSRFSLVGMVQERFRIANEDYTDVTMADPLETEAVDSAIALVIPTSKILEVFEQHNLL
jgi:hypothetical protein